MGYAGGTKKGPTYYDLGDHTETVRVVYDPKKVSYAQLLESFWAGIDPAASSPSRQYRSVILAGNDEQKRLALSSKAAVERRIGRQSPVAIEQAREFYAAEDYHQKYYLRGSREVMTVLKELYPSEGRLLSSTAAARLNGYVSGMASRADLEKLLRSASLTPEASTRILNIMQGVAVGSGTCPPG